MSDNEAWEFNNGRRLDPDEAARLKQQEAELRALLPENRPFVIVESPFASDRYTIQAEHTTYLRRCLRDSFERGELPFASHAFFPIFLEDDVPAEQTFGICAGYRFWDFGAKTIAFYVDYGFSKGMVEAHRRAIEFIQSIRSENCSIDIRTIGRNPLDSEIPPFGF